MARRHIAVLFAAFLLAACGDDFLPPSVLADLRVLAVPATPLEAGPGETVALRPVVFVPEDEQLDAVAWTFCPFHLGSSAGYRCVAPACETALPLAADGSVSAVPSALGASCAAGAQLPVGGLGAVPEQVEALFRGRYRSSSGLERQVVLPLPLWLAGPPAQRNRHPAVTRVELDGQPLQVGTPAREARPDDELTLRVLTDETSMDPFVDEAGRQRVEEPLVSFYTTAGRLGSDREAGADARTTLRLEQLEPGQTEARLYVVVRDLRGGQAAAGPFVVPIRR
jgi:hypothetical protein